MISKYKVYWELLKATKTPLIFMLDRVYMPTLKTRIQRYLEEVAKLEYIADIMDCDNFAFAFKGFADMKGNSVGIVYGKYKDTMHCWNVALLGYDTVQIEPQQGIIRELDYYKPYVVII